VQYLNEGGTAHGNIDIVFSDILGNDVSNRNKIRVLLNDGTGNFTRHGDAVQANRRHAWTATRLVDLDGDGHLDLVLGGMSSEHPTMVYWGDGSGSFGR
jgi:DNA/RNA endonuclease YhcR with UshA esterase domain